jgi:ribose transport system substrate-binding protein
MKKQFFGWQLSAVVALTLCIVFGFGTMGTADDKSDIISSVGRIGDVSELRPITDFCGDEPIRVALVDGFGGNSWRRITRFEFEDEAAKCDNITEVIYVDGQNNPQKTISDLQGLVAQSIEAIVVFPDAGPAMLPAIRQAFRAGTSIVAYTASPGGTPGKDYVDFIAPNTPNDGASWAQWIADRLNGKGKVIFLGGTPGNLQSQAELQGINEVFANYPGLELLGGRPIDTNWDPAETQRVVSGLLTQHKQIDGIISDYGGGSVGGIRAFLSAGRPLIPWAANDANEFACLWAENRDSNPNFQIMTVSSRTWLVRLALRKALAHAQGIPNDEPSIVNVPTVEDSTRDDLQPKCEPSLPPDAILSSGLTPEQLKDVFK